MSVQITEMRSGETGIEGLRVITLKQVSDARGTVREFFRASALADFGAIRQINVTESGYGAVRGLHGESTTKLVGCVSGEAFGAYLDARPDSASYGKLVTVELTAGTQVLVPPGVCNGFQSVSREGSQYLYLFTDEWYPGMPGTAFSPLDDGLGFSWPIPVDADDPAQISAKDVAAPKFSEQIVGS
ncbi:MAG: dTDP-4-dehydrorhamnose 3,5-epimerase family protein [Jatrophihabitantaceae bacterium]